MEDEERPRAQVWFWRIWTLIGAAVALGGAWWLLRDPIGIILPPLALAAVVVYLLNPVVGFLEHRHVPRAVGTLLSYLILLGALVGIGFAVGPILARQGGEFVDQLPQITTSVQDTVNTQLTRAGIDAQLNIDLESTDTQQAIRDYIQRNRDQIFSVLKGAGSVVARIFHGLLTLILAPILAFYLLADLPRLSDGVKRFMPPGPRSEVIDVARRIGATVGAYFRGQLLVATFVGIATSIGLLIVGLPFWALVGISTGVFNLVPLIGPFIGGLIGVVIALTVGGGMSQAIAVVVVMVLVQQVDNHVITPNIVSRTVKVHPVTVILGLLVAGSLYGIVGMFVAIPAIAAAKLVIMYVLVTRVPSMQHLAAEGGAIIDGVEVEEDPGDGTLVAMGREMRRAWERRRGERDTPRRPDR